MRTILLSILVLLICVPPVTPGAPATASVSSKKRVKTKPGLIYEAMVKGKGRPAKRGQTVRIHETLSLRDGRVIYNSRSKNEPVKFLLGGNQVIAGVDEGVASMRVGERRKLIRNGIIDYSSFVREVETMLFHGDTVIVMGLETIKPVGNAPFAGQTVRRRFTHFWMKKNGKWLLTARHANVICQN